MPAEPAKRPSGRSRQAAKAAAAPPQDPPAPGRVGLAVAALVAGLDLEDDLSRAALAELALTLAAHLDAGAGMAAAAVAKELRATLHELEGDGVPDDDDAFARWEADLANPG